MDEDDDIIPVIDDEEPSIDEDRDDNTREAPVQDERKYADSIPTKPIMQQQSMVKPKRR